MKKIFGRIYQKILYVCLFFIKFKQPLIIKNDDELISYLKNNKLNNLLIISGKTICKQTSYNKLVESLNIAKFSVNTCNEIEKEPSIDNILNAFESIKNEQIDCIIAVGGGSTIDASKILACKISSPKQDIRKLRGLLKVKKMPIPLIAVPTTCGSGSECTVASVIKDVEKNEKYAVNDPKLLPCAAYLNPLFLTTLPKKLLAETSLDALTHAIEAFIGNSLYKDTKKCAILSINTILENLKNVYQNPTLEGLNILQIASYNAGIAFTKSYVGYVHAISHSLGAYYNVSHGLANALVLPIVLRKYGKCIDKKITENKIDLDLKTDNAKEELILKIEDLIESLNISYDFKNTIKEEDYNSLIQHIKKEVYPLYPVPRYFSDLELVEIFEELKK